MSEPVGRTPSSRLQRWTGWPAAVVLLAVYALLATTSALRKSVTFDEVAHLTAGTSYWLYDDYRLNPENGNLPQRLVALPAWLGSYRFPSLDQPAWRDSEVFEIGHQFLFTQGNDVDTMVLAGRLLMILTGVLLGVTVYGVGRQLFGPLGATVSLIAYAFNPHMLAHSRLMTSDIMASLFFLLAVWSLWRLLHGLTGLRLLGSCLAMAGLFLSKMSAVLVLPMALILVALRLSRRRPWSVRIAGWGREVSTRSGQLAVAAVAAGLHLLVIGALLWAFYGLHYSAFDAARTPTEHFEAGVPNLLGSARPLGRAVQFAQTHHLLPEAYLYGFSFAIDQSERRLAFLGGERSEQGWRWFFPYAFAVKTSEALMLLLVLAATAGLRPWRGDGAWGQGLQGLYRTAPLWVLLAVYGWFALGSRLNIGHRHLLPLYPALFLLAGAAWRWADAPRRVMRWALAGVLALVAVTGVGAWPDYLSYFNRVSGGPAHGYLHLVDSSLDWGQDLPALRRWLEAEGLDRPGGPPVYFSYFGTSSPDHHGIRALRLPGFFDLGRRRALVPLEGGVYAISASMLQLYSAPATTPWGSREEHAYREQLARIGPALRRTMRPIPYGDTATEAFDRLRLGRLCEYLRRGRPPDDAVGNSILIFRLTDAEVEQALYGDLPGG